MFSIRTLCFRLVLGGLVLGVFPASAQEKETITWARFAYIPFYIVDGPYKDQGIGDRLIDFYEKYLPEYNHKRQLMSFARQDDEIRKKTFMCNALLLKTPAREKVFSFSNPVSPLFTHVLVTRKKMNRSVDGISLRHFLANLDGRLVVENKRSYGKRLDTILNEFADKGVYQAKTIASERALELLETGHIDYFLETEAGIGYLLKLQETSDDIYIIPFLEETIEQFSSVACTQTSETPKLLKRINELLKERQASEDFRDILEFWLKDENKQRFRNFFDRAILKHDG
ncbi:TIGR02285 family protein [Terasakiella sp. A23]|uniref:TIGR02285 family protein n=1 Tax=Terasakiella sp. FCG-A23 TaxID=3080561 RepID=UPI0029534C39|nr:TIGR02285 family protein [Terasakiella sp. A23]MDV7340200.1 TIGR02285 family protein [Terasakiella sp. A23]